MGGWVQARAVALLLHTECILTLPLLNSVLTGTGAVYDMIIKVASNKLPCLWALL